MADNTDIAIFPNSKYPAVIINETSRILCAIAILICLLTLTGWVTHTEYLTKIIRDSVPINPLGAILLLASGISLWLVRKPDYSPTHGKISRAITLTISIVSLTKLLAIIFDFHFNPDQVLFKEYLFLESRNKLSSIAPNSAFGYFLLGISIYFIDSNIIKRKFFDLILIIIILISLLNLYGFIYRVKYLIGITSFIPMSFPSGICLFLFAISIFLARPDRGAMKLVIGENPVDVVFLRSLALILPLILGWIKLWGEDQKLYSKEFGTAIFAVFSFGFAIFLIGLKSKIQYKLREARKVVEKIIKRKNRELENINEELEAFSYSISYDLRTPLRSIDGFAHILLEDNFAIVNDEGKKSISRIVYNTKKMGRHIDDLLHLASIRKKEMFIGNVNMNNLVNQVLSEQNFKEIGIHFKIDPLPDVSADKYLIKQVWTNLISNAIKYSRINNEASIEIGSNNGESESVYYIRDNGIGFDMHYANKLFTVFQRLHSERVFEGTGIGLAIVKNIIIKHEGHVWAEGETNKGATFYFALPNKKVNIETINTTKHFI